MESPILATDPLPTTEPAKERRWPAMISSLLTALVVPSLGRAKDLARAGGRFRLEAMVLRVDLVLGEGEELLAGEIDEAIRRRIR